MKFPSLIESKQFTWQSSCRLPKAAQKNFSSPSNGLFLFWSRAELMTQKYCVCPGMRKLYCVVRLIGLSG